MLMAMGGRFHYFKSFYGDLAKFLNSVDGGTHCTHIRAPSIPGWKCSKRKMIVMFKTMLTGQDGAALLTGTQDMPSVMVAAFCLILLTLILMVILIFSHHSFLFKMRGSLIVKGPGDFRGDSLCWFENPGASSAALSPWTRRTIDNWYTSSNPTGRGFEAVASDIDNDGQNEIVFSNHNHQDYKPNNVPSDPANHRIWPSGIYYFEIPSNPKATSQWTPISFDTGDPNLDPTNATAVANDVYAVDRPGGPYSQGSPGTVRADDMNGDRLS